MTTSVDYPEVCALSVAVTGEALVVDLADGRTIMVPVSWFPRLAHADEEERAEWRLIGRGSGIHWPAIDEDISIESLLSGRKSAETGESLLRWLASRERR